MRAAIFNEPRSVTVGERRDPSLIEATDAVARVVGEAYAAMDERRSIKSMLRVGTL